MAHTKLKLPHNKLISAPEDLGLAVLKLPLAQAKLCFTNFHRGTRFSSLRMRPCLSMF